ncbi:cell division topological specificity factor MinE [Fusibacter tunisiensis]|uniref:Cell division topological specificity factor n=1 Tax=Fusibacter tunisiensis TaxID=1008308 RepID=A0ABS2MMX7_9FIRM|nr:cell division topological specificity factor MinE [Fusibacter tunisiensis]MBM7560755.1 cell division topological specificity factor [Fusibacter tunisiensis]
MFDLFGFLNNKQTSKNVAKDRLKLVLVHDRSNCSPELLELLKKDILSSISEHVDYDTADLDIKITRTRDSSSGKPVLVANIPLKNLKR